MSLWSRLLRGSDASSPTRARRLLDYENKEYNLRLSYPADWTIASENQIDQMPWVQPLRLQGTPTSEGKPFPCITVLVNVVDEDGPPRITAYMEKAESDLRRGFPGFALVSRSEKQLLGWPSAWLVYTYQTKRGTIQEMNVTAFIGKRQKLLLQFLCEGDQVDHESLTPLFETVIWSAQVGAGGLCHPHMILVGARRCSNCSADLTGKKVHAMMALDSGQLGAVCDECRTRAKIGA